MCGCDVSKKGKSEKWVCMLRYVWNENDHKNGPGFAVEKMRYTLGRRRRKKNMCFLLYFLREITE